MCLSAGANMCAGVLQRMEDHAKADNLAQAAEMTGEFDRVFDQTREAMEALMIRPAETDAGKPATRSA